MKWNTKFLIRMYFGKKSFSMYFGLDPCEEKCSEHDFRVKFLKFLLGVLCALRCLNTVADRPETHYASETIPGLETK